MTTWSTHSGRAPDRSSAARVACAPSSSAETSLKAPTYSAMGVRAPPRITTSSLILNDLVRPGFGGAKTADYNLAPVSLTRREAGS